MRIHIVDTNVPRPEGSRGEVIVSMDEAAYIIKALKGRTSAGIILCSSDDFEARDPQGDFVGKLYAFPREHYTRKCLTQDAMFHTRISDMGVNCEFGMPEDKYLELSKGEAKVLTDDLHDAIESVMAKFFK